MIISASRRTDIPSFYGEWFMNRLKEGFVCVKNPFNIHAISKVKLNPEVVDIFVFWTKDPLNFIKYLPEIDNLGYKYYFQFTITPYNKTIETAIRNKNEIIKTFIELSSKIGKEKVIWRYDPILLSDSIDMEYHIQKFEEMAKQIAPYTETVIISFLDDYKKIDKNKNNFRKLTLEEMKIIGQKFVEIAQKYKLQIKTCAEEIVFTNGIEKASCIDEGLISKIIGCSIAAKKDKNQRKDCLCVESIDIGEYDTCAHFCEYCYANTNCKKISRNIANHKKNSPLLIGDIEQGDTIHEREVDSIIKKQTSFFDDL